MSKVADYKIKGRNLPGAMYLRYQNGDLTLIAIELTAQVDLTVWDMVMKRIPFSETQLHLGTDTFEIKRMDNARSVQDKVIKFCSAYKAYRGVPYNPTTLEKANLKNVAVDSKLLETFFQSPLANFSMKNYIDRINITRDWAKNGMNAHLTFSFPDVYDKEFERGLEGDRLAAYWKHLRERGWVKDEVFGWRKQSN